MEVRKKVALALLAVAVGGCWIWPWRDPASSLEQPLARNASLGEPALAMSETPTPLPQAAHSGLKREPIDPATTAKVGLRLHVVDFENGEPIGELAFELLSAGHLEHRLRQGRTDAEGHALLTELPLGWLTIRSERRPPHAEATGRIHLEPGGLSAYVLRVGHGGSLRGRVENERGEALADVPIHMRLDDPWSAGLGGRASLNLQPIVARTDAQGEFEVHQLLTRQRSLPPTDEGVPRSRPEPVYLEAANPFLPGAFGALVKATVASGQRVELDEPLVIRSARTLTGQVQERDGSPAQAVLVLTDAARRSTGRRPLRASGREPYVLPQPFPYWAADFVLGAGEAITGPAGEFQLQASRDERYSLCVVTRGGKLESFSGPLVKDAQERLADVELRMRAASPLTFRLVDQAGEPVGAPQPQGKQRFTLTTRFPLSRSPGDGTLECLLSSGEWESVLGRLAREGTLHVLPTAPAESIRVVRYLSTHFRPAYASFPQGVDPSRIHALEVVPLAPLELRITTDAPALFAADESFLLDVHACLASRAEREKRLGVPLEEIEFGGRDACCGLGVHWKGEWNGKPLELDMPVLSDDPYWVSITGEGAKLKLDGLLLGPFRPGATAAGEERTTLLVPGERGHAWTQPVSPWAGGPGRLGRGGQPSERSQYEVTLLDSLSGAPIERAYLEVRSLPGEPRRRSTCGLRLQGQGTFLGSVIFEGAFHALVKAKGYGSADLGRIELELGQITELGTIELTPRPVFRARLMEADGTPIPQGEHVRVAHRFEAYVGRDGLLTLDQELPEAFLLALDGKPNRRRVLAVYEWSASERSELQLPPMREVRIEFRGAREGHELASLVPSVEPLIAGRTLFGEPYTPSGWDPLAYLSLPEVMSGAPELRSFQARLGLGVHRLRIKSSLYSIAPTEFEVVEGEGRQVIAVRLE